MAKFRARHDESTANRAKHRVHAAEYRSGRISNERPIATDMRKWTDGRQPLARSDLIEVFQSNARELRVFPHHHLVHWREPVSRGERGVIVHRRAQEERGSS